MNGFIKVTSGWWVRSALLVMLAGGLSGCGRKPATVGNTALMPGADIVVEADLTAVRAAPIYQKLSEATDQAKTEEILKAGDAAELKAFGDRLMEATGLTRDDVSRFVLAAELDGVDWASADEKAFKSVDAAVGLSLTKPLTADALERALKAAGESAKKPVQVTRTTHRDVPVFLSEGEVESANEGTRREKVAFSVSGNGREVLAGMPGSVHSALDRSLDKKAASCPDSITALREKLGNPPCSAVLVLTKDMQAEVQRKVDEQLAQQKAGPQAALATAFRSLKAVAGSAEFGETLEVVLLAEVGSDEDASQIRTTLDTMVLGMAKFGLTMMAGGKPLPMLETLKAETVPGGMVRLVVAISPADVDVLREAVQKKAGGMASGLPGMPPVTP